MRRRDFISLLGNAAVAWPVAVHGQQLSVRHIGVVSPLSPSAATSPPFKAFYKTLFDLGYIEGRSIRFEYRWADGDLARLAAFASELANLQVDVIFCGPGTPTAMAVKKATGTIPIVFVGAGDAVGAGLVASLARPGGNATGLVNQSQDIAGKQMEILKEAVPSLSRMGVLWRPSNPSYRNLIRRFDDVVRATGVEVVLIGVENVSEFVAAFERMKEDQINGLLVQADALFIAEGTRIVELAAEYKIPAIYRLGEQAEAGGFIAYGPDIPGMYRKGALLVDKILKGVKPADLPVEQPTKIELVINLKTAKALGITVPLTLLGRADEVGVELGRKPREQTDAAKVEAIRHSPDSSRRHRLDRSSARRPQWQGADHLVRQRAWDRRGRSWRKHLTARGRIAMAAASQADGREAKTAN